MNLTSNQHDHASFSRNKKPLRMGIAGLSHDHVRWILRNEKKTDVKIVGIAEPDKQLSSRYQKEYNLDESIIFADLEDMLDTQKPVAVCAFNSIKEHLQVVQKCAPRKIHVMVEKPLAFKTEHAIKMEQLALEHNIFLLTNFQTSWFSSTHYMQEHAFKKDVLGDVWKVVFHNGHKGPVERGCGKEFLHWLTDPEKNGGGALIDFGCYGPNIMSWLMKGETPIAVLAFTQTIKPEIYSNVEDEAIILLEYQKAQAIIQASWNWPINRKDIEVYGRNGQLIIENDQRIRFQKNENTPEEIIFCQPLDAPFNDPFSYFAAVINGEIIPDDYDLSSLKLNLLVTKILESAITSAKTGKKVYLKKEEVSLI